MGVAILLAGPLSALFPSPGTIPRLPGGLGASYELTLASILVLAVGMLFSRFSGRRRTWVFGWRTPANGGGWWLLPVALMGVLPAAAWAGIWTQERTLDLLAGIGAAAFALGASEVWFRGVVHGLLVPDYPVQRPRGPWRISRSAFASSAAYAVVSGVMLSSAADFRLLRRVGLGDVEFALAAGVLFFGVGLALAALRERSLSFLPGLLVQWLGLAIAGAIGVVFI